MENFNAIASLTEEVFCSAVKKCKDKLLDKNETINTCVSRSFHNDILNMRGFSLIEFLVSLVIIGTLTGLSIPLIRNSATESMYKKDIAKIEESISHAQALANSGNSRNCSSNEQQQEVKIVKTSDTSWQLVTYCIALDYNGVDPTPTPYNPIPYTFESSVFDGASSILLATFERGSVVTPDATGFIVQNGDNTCTVTVNEFGVITKTPLSGICP